MLLRESSSCKSLLTRKNLLSRQKIHQQLARHFFQSPSHDGGPHHSKSEYHHRQHHQHHHGHHGSYHQYYSGEFGSFGLERLGSISTYSTFASASSSYPHERHAHFFNGSLLFRKLYSTVYNDAPNASLSASSSSSSVALDASADNSLSTLAASASMPLSGGLEFLTAAAGVPYHHQSLGVLSPDFDHESSKDTFYAYGCGDDAFFVRRNALAVADGVGGWSNVPGGNPALYSRTLLSQIYQSMGQLWTPGKAVEERMIETVEKAWRLASPILGSSTLAMAFLSEAEPRLKDGNTLAKSRGYDLYLYNLGDSGILVVRKGNLIYRSKEQCHRFNCPFQLGGKSKDTPRSAVIDKIPTEIGDVTVIGTDGLLDNLSDESILSIVQKHTALTDRLVSRLGAHVGSQTDGQQPALTRSQYLETKMELERHMKNMTLDLAKAAQSSFSSDTSLPTKGMAVNASSTSKMRFQGSKPDDVSVVAGLVVPCTAPSLYPKVTVAAKL